MIGDAGTGKTALLDHAVRLAAGMRVLCATCVESETDLAFAGLHLLLRPAVERLNTLPGPQAGALRAAFGLADAAGADRFLVGLATLTLLSELADGEPLLCVCDDAHWLDQASATALLFAARRLGAEGIALIFGTRGGGLLGGTASLPAITLEPLDQDAAGRLLDEHATDLALLIRDQIIELSQGNPLALIELPTALTAEQRGGGLDQQALHLGILPVSSRVEDAFAGQIVRLPERSRLLLAVAAAEDTGDLGIILQTAATLGASLADMAPAERARLVELRGDRVRFRHPLVRSAAYQSSAVSLRTTVHRALAEVLAAAGQLDREAWHLAASATAPDEAIAAKLERAAEFARERGGYAAEAVAFERAAQLSADHEAEGRRLARAAEATLASGHLRPASVMASRAMRMISDPVGLARLAELRANFEFETGATRIAARILVEGAVGIAPAAPDLAVRMLSSAVHYANVAGDSGLAMRVVDQVATLTLPPELRAFVPAIIGLGHMTADQTGKGVREIRGVLRVLAADVERYPPVMSRSVIGFALLAGDAQIALAVAAALAAQCRAQGMISMLPFTLTMLAETQLFLGRLTDARATGAEAMRIAVDTGQDQRVGHLNGVLARIAAVEGDERSCVELASHTASEDSGPAAWAGTSLSLLDLALGRYDTAFSRLADLAAGPARNTLIVTLALPDLVEAAAGAQREDRALAALARFEEFSSARRAAVGRGGRPALSCAAWPRTGGELRADGAAACRRDPAVRTGQDGIGLRALAAACPTPQRCPRAAGIGAGDLHPARRRTLGRAGPRRAARGWCHHGCTRRRRGPGRPAHRSGATGSTTCRGRIVQPRDRRRALPVAANCRLPPVQGVPQAQRHHAQAARQPKPARRLNNGSTGIEPRHLTDSVPAAGMSGDTLAGPAVRVVRARVSPVGPKRQSSTLFWSLGRKRQRHRPDAPPRPSQACRLTRRGCASSLARCR